MATSSNNSISIGSSSDVSRDDAAPFRPQLASECPKKRAGRKKFRETRHPVYRGVRQRNGDKWVCEVREPHGKARVWLGTYTTPEMAARAHDVAAMAFRGHSAMLNFADSAWLLPIPDTGDAADIRRAATEAAEMFRPAAEVAGEEGAAENSTPKEADFVPAGAREEGTAAFFIDDELELGMPMLMDSLAEGLLLPPLPPPTFGWGDEMDVWADVSLWPHSL